jgi:Kef-type K+ transport system membrane component KefB
MIPQWRTGGFVIIAKALGVAAVKAMVCITGIIFTGRMLLRPLMRRIAALQNADIFAATTLLVILGCSALTQMSGLSLALGAFLAGLLMAETEYALQVRPLSFLFSHTGASLRGKLLHSVEVHTLSSTAC